MLSPEKSDIRKLGGEVMTTEAGDRIKLVKVSQPDTPVSSGDTGTVWRVTPIGTVRVKWDSGARFDLNPGKDEWEVISNGHKEHETGL
jgi:hypothetical protein